MRITVPALLLLAGLITVALTASATNDFEISWVLGGDPGELTSPTWCEDNHIWQEGRQGVAQEKQDCTQKGAEFRCEMVTNTRMGKLFSTAQCVSR